jgi:hypothetical protein
VWAFVITGVISILGAASWVFVLGRVEPVRWSTAGFSDERTLF